MAHTAALDMTQGSLSRQIIGFSLPLMFTNLLQMLFSMVDLAVVGRFSSSAAMGSVGSTTTLIFLFTGFLMGLGSGANVLVATHFGARNEKNVRESVHTSFLVCLIAGFLMLALGLIFARPLLELLNTREDLIDGAELYLRIYFLGMPAAALYNYGSGVLSAIGDTKTPLIYLSTAGVLNVILDLVFVIGLGMSTDGVALASMISQCVSAGLIILSLARSKDIYGLNVKELRFHKDKAIRVLAVGVPAGLQNAIFSVANLFIQAGINSFSTVVVEGNSAAGNIDNLVYSVMNAFYIACSSFVGQNYGAGKPRRVMKSYLLTLAFSALAAEFLGGLFFLFGHEFLILLLVLLVLFLLLFQFGPAVLQLLFSVLDLLAGIRQFVGGIGQLLLGISQLFFGIGYFVPCFRYLFIQIVRHLLHPQFPTGFSHRLQRIFQCRG